MVPGKEKRENCWEDRAITIIGGSEMRTNHSGKRCNHPGLSSFVQPLSLIVQIIELLLLESKLRISNTKRMSLLICIINKFQV